MIPEIIRQFGISGMLCAMLYLVIRSSTEQRKEKRDAEIQVLEGEVKGIKESFTKHINHHQNFENNVCHKIDEVHKRFDTLDNRLYPISVAISKVEGYLEGKNDKS